ncbi:MAG: Flp pilus assembly protein CpaB [Hyphomonadaceae bacterium]
MRAFPVISLVLSIALGIGAVFLGKIYFSNDAEASVPAVAVEVTRRPETVRILVARRTLETGATVSAGDVRFKAWPRDMLPSGAVTDLDDLKSAPDMPFHALGLIVEGEPVVLEKLALVPLRTTLSTAIREGYRAVSIRVSSETGVAGFVLPDDRVDVIMVSEPDNSRGPSRPQAEIILQNVRVLAVDQAQETEGEGAMLADTVTLEVSATGAARISLSSEVGKLSLALRAKVSADTAATPDTASQVIRLSGQSARRYSSPSAGAPPTVKADITLIQGDREEKVQTPISPEATEASS